MLLLIRQLCVSCLSLTRGAAGSERAAFDPWLLICVNSSEVPPPARALAQGRGSQLGMRDTSGTK